jgi:hypothetical protein
MQRFVPHLYHHTSKTAHIAVRLSMKEIDHSPPWTEMKQLDRFSPQCSYRSIFT